MARKKPAKKAKKKSAGKPAARKMAPLRQAQGRPDQRRGTKKTAKKASKKAAKKASKPARKSAAKPAKRPLAKAAKPVAKAKASAKATAGKPKGRLMAAVGKLAKAAVTAGVNAVAPAKKPNLDRPRKTVADVHGIPSSLDMGRTASAAKSGRAEMRDKLSKSTGSGPALTGGDVDADWQSAESVGDEAPGGDNPTPDQDVVDDIGRSLGVEYEDDEELQGGAEIADRDRNRWELDPSSKDDFGDDVE
jgi:hypothetical protein